MNREKNMKRIRQALLLCPLLFLCLTPAVLEAGSQDTVLSRTGDKLVVGVTHDPPYLMKRAGGEWTGINADIWKAMTHTLKVDYEFREMTFEQLLDALAKRKIDIAVEGFFILSDRMKTIDYSMPVGNTRLAVATLQEKIHHPWWTAVKIFFSWSTFKILFSLCLVLILLGTLFWFIERNHNPDHFGGDRIKGIGSGIYWVGSTLASGVCFGIHLKSLPARILGLIWMLACAVALSALIASLTNTLAESRSMVEAVSDETLRNMHLAGIKGSAEMTELKSLGCKFTAYPDEEEALKAVLKGDVDGFLYDEITLHYYRENDFKDRISVYPTHSKKYYFAFGLPRKSPLREKINYALIHLMERPEWSYILKRYGLRENFEKIESPPPQKSRGMK
jgi:polar amino acid transport system substrate-binding protein